jgi:hypothetical protein
VGFDGYNLRSQDLTDVVEQAERVLSLHLDRSTPVYGTQGATVGYVSSGATWVRLGWRALSTDHEQSWTGTEGASAVPGVRKPSLYRSYRWTDDTRSVVWRADEFELINSTAVGAGGLIRSDPALPDAWWDSLKSSLDALGIYQTHRVGMAQAHLTKRINQVFGEHGIDTTVSEWRTAHTDLHWNNVTAPSCYLLDWEDWGAGPRGLDAATLWGCSLQVPEVAHRVQTVFAADLSSRSGLLAQLLFCSNVIRLSSSKPTPSPLFEPAKREAARVLDALGVS